MDLSFVFLPLHYIHYMCIDGQSCLHTASLVTLDSGKTVSYFSA